VPGEGTGVYALHAEDAALLQVGAQGALAGPVAVVRGVLAHQDGGGLDTVGLVFAWYDTVVADKWVGEEQYLPLVRRVREGLLVADHARREDDLARHLALSSEAPTPEDRPVLKDQGRPAAPLG
jgi:hypothetical protein